MKMSRREKWWLNYELGDKWGSCRLDVSWVWDKENLELNSTSSWEDDHSHKSKATEMIIAIVLASKLRGYLAVWRSHSKWWLWSFFSRGNPSCYVMSVGQTKSRVEQHVLLERMIVVIMLASKFQLAIKTTLDFIFLCQDRWLKLEVTAPSRWPCSTALSHAAPRVRPRDHVWQQGEAPSCHPGIGANTHSGESTRSFIWRRLYHLKLR